jgi:endonuclease/exonuclease/phosphatase family metal-dependent hydrolase
MNDAGNILEPLKCLAWNVEWKASNSPCGVRIREIIQDIDPDVVCYTEVTKGMIPEGHFIQSGADYGYKNHGNRSKVVLWSKQPWSDVDTLGSDSLPEGRFASGITSGIRFVGVCIPWRDAHVSSGRKDRQPWEDHMAYLVGLTGILKRYSEQSVPVCLLGDYNQRIPRISQPFAVAEALAAAIPDSFTIATTGMKDREGVPLVDHFSFSQGLTIAIEEIIPKVSPEGPELSDHPGIVAFLNLA